MKSMNAKTGTKKSEDKIVHMSFDVSEKLRNQFKSKITGEGKKVKDVLAHLMTEYLKEKK